MNGKSRRRASKRGETQPMVESLEGRALMSATAPVVVAAPAADPGGTVGRPQQGIIAILIGLVSTKSPAPLGGGVTVAAADVGGDNG
jgi:hypothetical protein